MRNWTRSIAVALTLALGVGSLTACESPPKKGTDRWTVTENTNVAIDWDAVNVAYKQAEGPDDFEKKVNEIYTGDEMISVSVQDGDDKSQVVTGFFDKNTDGQVQDEEKVFSITRAITAEGTGNYQTVGYGHYGAYHSPMFDIAAGMLMGSMISRAFMPNYMPMYSAAYVTSPSRAADLRNQRASYRAQNPSKFAKPSQSGRSYGSTGKSRSSSGRSGGYRSGGGRFGATVARTAMPRTRLV